tara:strand:+ start:567 stop:896 length:330 start_codon:yes stop_codon:yes gene_type:complete
MSVEHLVLLPLVSPRYIAVLPLINLRYAKSLVEARLVLPVAIIIILFDDEVGVILADHPVTSIQLLVVVVEKVFVFVAWTICTIPVGPVGPVGPVDPEGPVGPVEPVEP